MAHFESVLAVWYEVPINVMYNVGYMWTDLINYCFYTPSTVPQNDWAFFTYYLIGDFLMRFWYRDENPLLITS